MIIGEEEFIVLNIEVVVYNDLINKMIGKDKVEVEYMLKNIDNVKDRLKNRFYEYMREKYKKNIKSDYIYYEIKEESILYDMIESI